MQTKTIAEQIRYVRNQYHTYLELKNEIEFYLIDDFLFKTPLSQFLSNAPATCTLTPFLANRLYKRIINYSNEDFMLLSLGEERTMYDVIKRNLHLLKKTLGYLGQPLSKSSRTDLFFWENQIKQELLSRFEQRKEFEKTRRIQKLLEEIRAA